MVIIFNFFISFSYAKSCEEGCKIKNGPAEVLREYISNNRKIISNISSQLGKINSGESFSTGVNINGKNITKKNSYNKNIGLRVYNSLFNWQEVAAGFKGFLAGIDGETPRPIIRDFMMLESQNEALNVFLERIISNGHYSNSEIFSGKNVDKICEGVNAEVCAGAIFGKDVKDVIIKLIKNNNKISFILKWELGTFGYKAIAGEQNYEELFLVPENFKEEIKKNYNKSTHGACARCSGGSLDKINKAIEKITQNDKDGKRGFDEWTEAWDLLVGIGKNNNSKEYELEEKELLNRELGNKGISSKNGDSVLKGLEDFNNDGLNLQNNPIMNSFRTFKEQFNTPLAKRTKNDLSEVWANISESSNTIAKSFSLSEITVVKEKLKNTDTISRKIEKLIKLNEAILSRQNINSGKLQARIIQMHINLSQTINKLDETIPKSEKVCKDQDSSNPAKCSFR